MAAMTGAESIAAAILALLATAIGFAYVADLAGFPIQAFLALAVAAAAGAGTLAAAGRRARWDWGEVAAFVSVVAAVFGWLLSLAWPSLLPVGRGSDLAHHLVLIDYIEHHGRLVHGAPAGMGEMALYSPGSHVLIAIAGAWLRSDGLHAAHSVVAFTVALKAGFVFLMTLRLLPAGASRIPVALSAVLLLAVPRSYVVGGFTQDSFLAQVVSELFAVGMWWALAAWEARRGAGAMVLFALSGAAAFLSWPVWIGPPMLALVCVALGARDRPLKERAAHAALGAAPIVAVAAVYMASRLQGLAILQTGGSVLRPTSGDVRWWFVLLAAAGLVLIIARARSRATIAFTGAIAAQAAVLFAVASARGADSPYLALKMFYLAVYPLSAAGAVALGAGWHKAVCWSSRTPLAPRLRGPLAAGSAWALIALAGIGTARQLAAVPRPVPVVSEALYQAGSWAREHVERGCVDYLVRSEHTGYWLHLAVLRNPREGAWMNRPDAFDPHRSMARWIEPAGLPFAIADLSILPNDVRTQVDVLAQFGGAAVIGRRGATSCAERLP